MSEKTQQPDSDIEFTSTKGSGKSWNPKQNADKVPYAPAERSYDATVQPDHKTKDIFIGYLIDIRHGIGEHNSTVYTFVPKSDLTDKIDVWGDTVLNKEFEKVPGMNILCKIEWLGQGVKKDKKEGQKGAAFNKWFVGFNTDFVLPGKTATKLAPKTEEIAEEKTETPAVENKAAEKNVVIPTTMVADNDDLPF